ncbi:hypothetical protein AAMO2058_000905500 [Amorphochlora amoebiformis]
MACARSPWVLAGILCLLIPSQSSVSSPFRPLRLSRFRIPGLNGIQSAGEMKGWRRMAKGHVRSPIVWRCETEESMKSSSANMISPIVLNRRIVSSKDLPSLLNLAEKYQETLSPINVVSALHKAAKLKNKKSFSARGGRGPSGRGRGVTGGVTGGETEFEGGGWGVLIEKAEGVLGELNSQGISNLVWALAKLEHPSARQILDKIQPHALSQVESFNGQNIANTLWAYATLTQSPSEALLDAILQRCRDTAGEFRPQSLANTLWAFARLTLGTRTWDRNLAMGAISAVQKATDSHIQSFNTQELCNTLWGLAKLACIPAPPPSVLNQAGDLIKERAQYVNQKDLDHALWAFGVLRHPLPLDTILSLESRELELIPGLSAESLARLFHNFARLAHVPSKEINIAAAERVRMGFKSLNNKEVSTLYWAGAAALGRGTEVEEGARELVESLENKLDIQILTPSAVSRVLWAYGKLSIQPGEETQLTLTDYITKNAHIFPAPDIARCIWAFGEVSSMQWRGGLEAGKVVLERSEEVYNDLRTTQAAELLKGIVGFSDHVAPNISLLEKIENLSESRALSSMVTPLERQALQAILFRLLQLGYEPTDGFLETLSNCVDVSLLSPRQIADTLWAIAKIERDVSGLSSVSTFVNGLLTRAPRLHDRYLLRDVPDVLSAMARLEHKLSQGEIQPFFDRITVDAKRYASTEIATSFWAFAKLEVEPDLYTLDALQKRATVISGQLTPEMAKVMMWSFARIDIDPDRRLVMALNKAMSAKVNDPVDE